MGRRCSPTPTSTRYPENYELVDRNDPIAEIIAKKIVELGQRGVREAEQVSELAIKELGVD